MWCCGTIGFKEFERIVDDGRADVFDEGSLVFLGIFDKLDERYAILFYE